MANALRGEVAVSLGGAEHVLRPNFEALAELEGTVGNLVPFTRRVLADDYGIRDIAAVLACGIKGAGGKVPGDLGRLVLEAGLARLQAPVLAFLLGALRGGVAEGNGEAAGAS